MTNYFPLSLVRMCPMLMLILMVLFELMMMSFRKADTSKPLRQRKISKVSSGEDLDALLRHHHAMQEKIAEDMLSLARNLKEQSHLASTIIKRDTEVGLQFSLFMAC